jgi:hypothetical protein
MPTPAHEVFEAFWRAPSSYDRGAKVGTGIDRALGERAHDAVRPPNSPHSSRPAER